MSRTVSSPSVATKLGIPRQGLIPAKLSADTPQDSLVFSVTGLGADPEEAAALANTGAKVFVAELNKGGSTVGVFAVQSIARVPLAPVSPALGAKIALTICLIAGAVFGVGVLMLLVLLRRPMVTPNDVSDQFELPGLGVLTLPPRRDTRAVVLPENVPGATRVTRQVLAADVPTVLVVAAQADAVARQQTAQVLAIAMAFTGPVVYLGDAHAERDVNVLIRQRAIDWPEDEESGARVVVVDVFNLLDTLRIRNAKWGVVLVGPAGSSRALFDRLLGDFHHHEVIGIVLYRRKRRRLRVLKALAPAGSLSARGTADAS